MLELSNIKKSYGEDGSRVEALKDISLSVGKGEFVVLLGPSGSGKSTLLNIIGGIDTADSGNIRIRDKNMSDNDASNPFNRFCIRLSGCRKQHA